MIEGLFVPSKPAIIVPKPPQIVRPTDPKIVLPPLAPGGMILNPYSHGVAGFRYWRLHCTAGNTASYIVVGEIQLMIGGVDQIPLMTGNPTSGVSLTSSQGFTSGYQDWKAGNNNSLGTENDNFLNTSVTYPVELVIDFGAGNEKAVETYTVGSGPTHLAQHVKDWDLQSSADGSAYTTRHSVTGATGWGANETRGPYTVT